MGMTRAFHAGSTGSNPVRGIPDESADPAWFCGVGVSSSAHTSPTSREKCLHDEPTDTHTPDRLMLLGTLLLIMFAALCLGPHKAAASPSVIGCKRVQGIERRACIIRVTFGRHGADAVRVARCESGFDPAARDYLTGTHWGVFQLGPAERRAYGHGRTVLAQARAARKLFAARGWQPWVCKP